MLISSCRVDREKAIAANNENVIEERAVGGDKGNAPEIIFLNYSIKKSSTGSPEIRFTNKIIANGSLKASFQENSTDKAGDLKCIELDAGSQPIKSIIIPNPLQKTVEYVSESGQLGMKEVELDSAEFSVRLQLDPKTESIAIEQIGDLNGDSTNFLIVTKIK